MTDDAYRELMRETQARLAVTEFNVIVTKYLNKIAERHHDLHTTQWLVGIVAQGRTS